MVGSVGQAIRAWLKKHTKLQHVVARANVESCPVPRAVLTMVQEIACSDDRSSRVRTGI